MISRDQALWALERHERELRERLQAGQGKVSEAEEALGLAKQERLGLINEAMSEGWTLAKVGEVFGLSRQRIAQIRKEDADAGTSTGAADKT